jgi:RNA polymerase sigma-70 factor (ECF subfamily)
MELFAPPPRILLDAMLERDALEKFVDEYADRAYGFAYGLCGNEAEARELTQEAFVKIFERAEQFDATQSLETWFLTVLKNVFRDSLRRWERKSRVSLDAPIGEDGESAADSLPDANEEAMLDRLEREESAARLHRALETLTPDARAIVALVDMEGLGYEEAAEALGLPLGTVRSRLNRAREVLRRRLLEMEG